MPIYLLDDSLIVNVYFELIDCEFADNICLSIFEECPEDEKVFRAGQSNIYLTAKQARQLAEALHSAAEESECACQGKDFKE